MRENRIALSPNRPDSVVGVLEADEHGWTISAGGDPISVHVKEVDEGTECESDRDAALGAVRLLDFHIVCFSKRPGLLETDRKWLFQSDAPEEDALAEPEAARELYSNRTKTILTRRRTIAMRAVTRNRSPFGDGGPVQSPVEQWGLQDSSFRKDLDHVLDLIHVDPEVALKKARLLLKGALRNRYRSLLGDPGNKRLGEVAHDLAERGHLPRKIVSLFNLVKDLTSKPGEDPIFSGDARVAREAHLALWCVAAILDWHSRVRPTA